MKFDLQYLNDVDGNTQAVQLPKTEWDKIVNKLTKYEQAFKLKASLKQAFKEVENMQKSKTKKQTLIQFLNEL